MNSTFTIGEPCPEAHKLNVNLASLPFNLPFNYGAVVTGSPLFTIINAKGQTPAPINMTLDQPGIALDVFTGNLLVGFAGATPPTITVPSSSLERPRRLLY